MVVCQDTSAVCDVRGNVVYNDGCIGRVGTETLVIAGLVVKYEDLYSHIVFKSSLQANQSQLIVTENMTANQSKVDRRQPITIQTHWKQDRQSIQSGPPPTNHSLVSLKTWLPINPTWTTHKCVFTNLDYLVMLV